MSNLETDENLTSSLESIFWRDENTSENENNFTYMGARELLAFHNWYRYYHGYMAVIVCSFGIIANILNVIILTRRSMISPTNCLLTGLAVSDGLTMTAYLPFALIFYFAHGEESSLESTSFEAAIFLLCYACFSVFVHTVSIWLTVTLAVFRYVFIKFPHKADLCSLARAKLSIFLTVFGSLAVCIPNFIAISIAEERPSVWVVTFKVATPTERFIYDLNFWLQAVLVKLVPCVGLTILSVLLVITMRQADKKRQQLRNGRLLNQSSTSTNNSTSTNPAAARETKTQRTTIMLLVIVALFLLTEFPQGVMSLLGGILPETFVKEIYTPLGDFIDIITLVNNGINFVLYCVMSRQFRRTFIDVLSCKKSKGFEIK